MRGRGGSFVLSLVLNLVDFVGELHNGAEVDAAKSTMFEPRLRSKGNGNGGMERLASTWA
jgi:hypothetical protein